MTQADFKSLAGKKNSPLIIANMPSTAIPRILNGSRMIHTMGYSTSARIARGQEMINNNIQSRKVNISQMYYGFYSLTVAPSSFTTICTLTPHLRA